MKTETILKNISEVESLAVTLYYATKEPRDLRLAEIADKITKLRKRLEREVA